MKIISILIFVIFFFVSVFNISTNDAKYLGTNMNQLSHSAEAACEYYSTSNDWYYGCPTSIRNCSIQMFDEDGNYTHTVDCTWVKAQIVVY